MKFDTDIFSILINIQILACLLLMIIKRKKLGTNINYMIVGTLFSFLSNFLGKVLIEFKWIKTNHFVFNIGVLLITFFFYLYYFYRQTVRLKLKRIQFSILIIFLITYITFFFIDKDFIMVFPIKFYFIETILLLISISVFLTQTFKSEIVLNINHYFPFWLSLGLLILYCGLMPILIIGTNPKLGMNIYLFTTIMFFINFIGYGVIIRGIFLSKT